MKTPFLLLGALAALQTCSAKCYYPDGTVALDFPCDADAENSVCCGDGRPEIDFVGFACLSNKMCQSSKGRIIRGSCTDPTWKSPECANYCLEWSGGGHDLVSCYNVTRKDTSYCCAGVANCCDSGAGRFEVLPAQPYTWALWDDAKTQYVVKTPLSTAASSSTSSTTSTATSSSTTIASTTSHASDQTTSSSSVSTPSSGTGTRATTETGPPGQSATNQPSTDAVQSSGLSTGAQAGIGVGAALGALLLAAVAYLSWKLRKTRKAMAGGTGSQWQGYPQDPYSTPPPAPGSYYPQDPRQKFELQGDRGMHELQGHHYFVRGDANSAELNAQPSYSPESPVVTR